MVFQGCFMEVSRGFQESLLDASWNFQGCFKKGASKKIEGCSKRPLSVIQGYLKEVQRVFGRKFKGYLKKCQEYFKKISKEF